MEDSNDVFNVLGWGIRRHAWLISLCVLTFGLLLPGLLHHAKEYDARAFVGPSGPLAIPNINSLPRTGTTVFQNGAVADAVRHAFTPPLRASEPVIPSRVELIAPQDNVVFTVVGHGNTPKLAQRLANLAATTFDHEMNLYQKSVGPFAIQRAADLPANPRASVSGKMALALGMSGGLVVGVGLVALLMIIRRPVTNPQAARALSGAPVLARLHVTRQPTVIQGLPRLGQRLLRDPPSSILLVGSRGTAPERHRVALELSKIIASHRDVEVEAGSAGELATAPLRKNGKFVPQPLRIVIDPGELQVASRPSTSLVLLLVWEGVSRRTLSALAEMFLDSEPNGVLLLNGNHFGPRVLISRLRARTRPMVQRFTKTPAPATTSVPVARAAHEAAATPPVETVAPQSMHHGAVGQDEESGVTRRRRASDLPSAGS